MLGITIEEVVAVAEKIGYPVLARPSYVLGAGRWKLYTPKNN